MIKSIKELDETTISNIKKFYNVLKMSVSNISYKLNLDRNIILEVLKDDIEELELCNTHINHESFIAISDTHIGSFLDKILYLEYVYQYASKMGIKDIIHAGDLLQSTITPVNPKYIDPDKQIEYMMDNYPMYNINTHILFGNHDYHLLSKDDEHLKVIKSRPDFKILGFKRAYINFLNNLICVSHPIDKYKVNIPNVDPLVRIIGHRHSVLVEKNNLYLPSLCLDQKYYGDNTNPYPGFIYGVVENDKLNLYLYAFQELLKNKKDKQEIKDIKKGSISPSCYGLVLSLNLRDNNNR